MNDSGKKQTVVVWDSCDADVKFFVVDRDLSHLNRKYVNSSDTTDAKDREISMLAYDEKTGKQLVHMVENFPVEAVRNGASVVVCGFIP